MLGTLRGAVPKWYGVLRPAHMMEAELPKDAVIACETGTLEYYF